MVYGLQKLDVDCKVIICTFLDPVSLARLSCTCRDWHATSVKDHLWQQIAQDRWRFINCTYTSCVSIQGHNPQAACKGAATQHDWHRLYARNNQWNTSQLQKSQFQTPGSVYDFSMSRTPCTATNLDTCDSDHKVYILQADSLHIWEPSGNVLPSSFTLSATYDKLIETTPGIVAATRQRLNDHIDILPVLEATDGCTLQARSTLPGTICGMVVDLQYCPRQQMLHALHGLWPDGLITEAIRSRICCWDMATECSTATMYEFLEQYELACFCIPDQDAAANELVAGAVTSDWCRNCEDAFISTLCCHKSTAKLAALCVFDVRAASHMVQRFSMHHRSLYPHMTCAREHFIFTSHVGSPLAVWDRRQMSHTVYEEGHLRNFLRPDTLVQQHALMLPPPYRPAAHQGLFLDTDGDGLLGRAENGMTWLWDLSSCLGWQRNGPTGTWLQENQEGHSGVAAEPSCSHMQPEDAGFCSPPWPRMLGAVPIDEEYAHPLPKIVLQNGRAFPITCISPGQSDQGGVACFRPWP